MGLVGCDFECQRQTNLGKLKDLYMIQLERYNRAFNAYLTEANNLDTNGNPRRPHLVRSHNNSARALKMKLDAILESLGNNIAHTDELLAQQSADVAVHNDEIHRKNRLISEQDSGIKDNNLEVLSKDRQIAFTQERNRYRRVMIISLVIINLLLVGLFYYLMKASKN